MSRILENVAIGMCALIGGGVMVILGLALVSHPEAPKTGLPANSTLAGGSRPTDISNAYQPPLSASPKAEHMDIITIDQSNSVTMDQVFDDESVNKVMRELQTLSDKNSPKSPLYLVINSPGGSVDAGMKLIAFARALPQKVKTITIFAASMGFQTVQGLDERLITVGGTLMSHPASFGVQGSTPYQVVSRLKWILQMIEALDQHDADRMQITLQEYEDLVHDEYWVTDKKAVKDHAADRSVGIRCGKYASPTKFITVATMFGNVEVEIASCPIIPGIVSFKMPSNTSSGVLSYVRLMLTDREAFTREYIVNNKFLEYQKQ